MRCELVIINDKTQKYAQEKQVLRLYDLSMTEKTAISQILSPGYGAPETLMQADVCFEEDFAALVEHYEKPKVKEVETKEEEEA